MFSDSYIAARLGQILNAADLHTTTTSAIRRQLEQDLGVDLSEKKGFIREQVNLYLQYHQLQQLHQQQQQQQQQQVPAPPPPPPPQQQLQLHLPPQQQQQLQPQHQQHQQYQHNYHQQHQFQLQQFQLRHQYQLQQQQLHQQLQQPHYPQERYDIGMKGEDLALDFGEEHVTEEVYVEEEEEEEDDGTEAKLDAKNAKNGKGKKESVQKEKKKRTNCGGLNKLCGISPELQVIIGEKQMTRTEVVKQLWVYIREKKLQDPGNRRKIICDDAMRAVTECDSTDMFNLNKLLAKHIFSLENSGDDGERKSKKPKAEKREGVKAKNGGVISPVPISEALMNFFGTGESELSRAEVVKRMWDYIKNNQLQDPSDKRRIVCDRKLQDLLNCDNFIGFSIAKLLAPHFMKS